MSTTTRTGLLCWLLPWLLAGCQVDLPKPTDIQFDRPLGAKASVVDPRANPGAPTRATPRPGESVRYEVALAFDDPMGGDLDQLSSLFIVCTAPEQFTGIPICLEFLEPGAGDDPALGGPPPDGVGGAPGGMPGGMPEELACDGDLSLSVGPFFAACVSGRPAFEFPIPSDFEGKAKLVLGVICQGGQAYLDPDPDDQRLLRCRDNADDGETMDVYGTVVVQQTPEDENLNPDLSQLQVTLADGAWELPDAELPGANCGELDATLSLPHIEADASAPHMIGLALDAAAITEQVESEREPLEIGAHATIEGLERLFTLFQPDKPADAAGLLSAELEFEVDDEEELQEGGQLVRFFFTARDRRGGFDVTERVACVTE